MAYEILHTHSLKSVRFLMSRKANYHIKVLQSKNYKWKVNLEKEKKMIAIRESFIFFLYFILLFRTCFGEKNSYRILF